MYDFQAIAQGFQNLFTLHIIIALLIGFGLGYVVGVIPGFNDANLMSIMLPFSLLLDPTSAIVTMSALYASAVAAGSIPAILMNIPGTPSSAATCFEGYPLAKQGLAGLALGISLASSTVGAVAGVALALLVSPVIGTFALKFGPAEMFMIAVLGMTVVGSLTGPNLAKGLLATVFGILISLIGEDAMTGYPRCTFGIYELYEGLPLVPCLLGLFGFSELIFLMKQTAIASKDSAYDIPEMKQVLQGIRAALRYPATLLRSSVIGEIIGIIPGAGTVIGGFISYGMAKQWSTKPEKFGKGHAEGLVAVDSANNAAAAGAMVPLLTLGIPGSGSTMVMLAALMLHGVRPGPRFFLNLQVEAYTILFSLMVASLLILFVGVPLARYAQKVTFVPTKVLVPVVAILLFLGSYAWRFVPFDIILMIVFGVMAVIFRQYGYPVTAVLLAIILGPIAENNFIRAISIGGAEIFYQSPIVLLLLALTLFSLFSPLMLRVFKNR
jgi:putative tricarboxylic transport membrane protein